MGMLMIELNYCFANDAVLDLVVLASLFLKASWKALIPIKVMCIDLNS